MATPCQGVTDDLKRKFKEQFTDDKEIGKLVENITAEYHQMLGDVKGQATLEQKLVDVKGQVTLKQMLGDALTDMDNV
ncbi:hypothetical protein Fmac_002893 [Flemingia macrophylla]|uniref:Uncharacterized protein n=1 Tax=Flemingia macrophylla TaxID=520843 RepID=A0ABD1NLZ7_9FABA